MAIAIGASGCGKDAAPPLEQRMAAPAYWTPALPEGQVEFSRLTGSLPPSSIVVVNGSHSAPEKPYNNAWSRTLQQLAAADIREIRN